ncbi:hypothetical protein BN1723_013327 [Verticillium longisporum]|uniref:Uncharacterized protein n=1 Tax=Verticillium longisporum TaxID=100787 RepID=A0A0G4LRE0_VERLO|nr:hypothetical protein BN1723_013327 [Verticillium longisporum]
MKWTSAIPLALLSALSTASPLPQEEPESYETQSDPTIYNLKIDAPPTKSASSPTPPPSSST